MAIKNVVASMLGVGVALAPGFVSAQAASQPGQSNPTRQQAKMERDEFLRTHRWDGVSETWVLKSNVEVPKGVASRAQVKSDRDAFLSKNRWDPVTETWKPVLGEPRQLSKLSREQVKSETRQFMRTHEWDEDREAWIEKQPRPPKK